MYKLKWYHLNGSNVGNNSTTSYHTLASDCYTICRCLAQSGIPQYLLPTVWCFDPATDDYIRIDYAELKNLAKEGK